MIKDSKEEARVDRVSIVAIDENGDLVLQTHRFLRYIPQPQHHLVLAKGVNTTWDFNTNSNSYAAIYNRDVSLTNIHSHPSQGWNYLETDLGAGAMVIGDGIQYLEKTFSAISFFLNVSSDPSQIPFVHIKLSYKMEEGIDCIVGRIRRSSQDPSDSPQNILHGVKEVDQTEDDEDDDPSVLFVLDGKGELDEDFHLSHFKGEDGLELEISFLTYDHHVVDGGAIVLEQVSFRSDQRKPVTGKSRLDKKRNNNNKRRKKIRRKQHLVW